MGPTLYSIELIGRGQLSVMAKPVAGEWIHDEFQGIASFGVKQVVSLLEVTESRDVGLEDEALLCEKFDMDFVSYPIKDRGLPDSIKRFAQFTKRLYNDIASGKNTVVHCRAGIGRTGLVAGAILLHEGFEPEQAFAHISKARGIKVPDTESQIDWFKRNHLEITRDV